MKAILLTAYGDVDRLQLRDDVAEPTAGPNEVKVRMAGASINPIDWKLRSGAYHAYMPLQLPAILGRDASGTVVAIGPGVTGFAIGERVMGRVNATYAELVVGPSEAWTALPAGMDLVDAGAYPLVLLTGAQLIEDAVRPDRGDQVLVTGATGSTGRVAVFAAKAAGARVLAGIRAKHRSEAAALGADQVVALDDEADVARLPTLDAIADTVGGETTQRLLDKLKAGGTVGSVVGEPKGARDRGLVVRAIMAHADSRRLAQLAGAVAEGKLVIPIVRRFPLAQAGQAQKLAESGAGGKVLLTG
jgi:NADPH:quinone reductase-like Zn-dependent oxidoreductase